MYYIAADFGAGSGRVIVGTISAEGLFLDEVHRFPNHQIDIGGRLYWDFPALFHELKTGLRKAFAKYGSTIKSMGVDTWGVDYALIDKHGHLISNPVCYRDIRTKGVQEKAFEKIPKEMFFSLAGNQFMDINTVFQLYSSLLEDDDSLKYADKLLFTPDLFNYFLTGTAVNEYTISSTSQMLNSSTGTWDRKIFSELGLPFKLMQRIVLPGFLLGRLTESVSEEVGGNIDVVAVGSHDTASALASIAATDDKCAFISSGTWSLMGVEIEHPIQTKAAMDADFTNEGTISGTIRFLKNITGLWLIQSLVREWEGRGETCNYATLVDEAERSSCNSVIDVSDNIFVAPKSMNEAITNYCKSHGEPEPITKGDFMRVICVSLAEEYAKVKLQLESCTGKVINTIHVVGGGSQNALLNRLTAEKTGCTVIAGPVEATAIGNIAVQAFASGELKTAEDLRLLLSKIDIKQYNP
ncbi:MAG: rhamnulokinase family protein [Bacteroidales bacterium]